LFVNRGLRVVDDKPSGAIRLFSNDFRADPSCCPLRIGCRHVHRFIRRPDFERLDVIDDVAGTGAGGLACRGAWIRPLKRSPTGRVSLDATPGDPFAGRALRTRGPGMAADAPAPGSAAVGAGVGGGTGQGAWIINPRTFTTSIMPDWRT